MRRIFFILAVALVIPSQCFAVLAGWNGVKYQFTYGTVGATLTDFPTLIKISASSGTGSTDLSGIFDELQTNDNMYKIAFTSSDDSTQLYGEIISWDDANEIAYVYVKFPSVTTGGVGYIYADKNQESNFKYISRIPNRNVWNSSYAGVFHLENPPKIADSTTLWLTRPRAYYFNGFTYYCYLDWTRTKLCITKFNHSTLAWSAPVDIATAGAQDGHNSPTMVINSAGYIFVFTGNEKGTGDELTCYKSTNTEDITAWNAAVNIQDGVGEQCAYSLPLLLSNDDICLIYRYYRDADFDYEWHRVMYDDSAGTWDTANDQTIIDAGDTNYNRAYVTATVGTSDRVHIAWHYCIDSSITMKDLYYAYTDDIGSATPTWKEIDGDTMTLPVSGEPAGNLVYDSDGNGYEQNYIMSMIVDSSNNPHIMSFLYDSGGTDQLAHFSYSAGWVKTAVLNSDNVDMNLDSAHVVDGHMKKKSDTNYVAAFTIKSGATAYTDIQEYETLDSGATWYKLNDITSHAADVGTYYQVPSYPENGSDTCKIIFMKGATSFDYDYGKSMMYVSDPQSRSAKPSLIDFGEDTTSTVSVDSSASASNGTRKSATEPAIGTQKINNGGDFDGSDDVITGGDIDLTNLTVSAWLKPDSASDIGFAVAKSNGVSAAYYMYWQGTTDKLYVMQGKLSSAVFNDTDWVHTAFSAKSAGAASFYRNGAAAGTATGATWSNNDIALTLGTRVGGTGADYCFDGKIDEVRIYNAVKDVNWLAAEYASDSDTLLLFTQSVGGMTPETITY